MPKRLGNIYFNKDKSTLVKLCSEKGLNEYETEIILRIYWEKQSLNYISDTMKFDEFGKEQPYYSVRSINNMHKEAFLKLIK